MERALGICVCVEGVGGHEVLYGLGVRDVTDYEEASLSLV